MLNGRFLAGLVVVGLSVPLSQGAIIANLTDPNDSYTIVEVNAAGGIIVGNLLFDEFVATPTATATAVSPGAAAIKVTGIQSLIGDYGLRFDAGWSAGGGQEAASTIAFRVTAEPQFAIKDFAMWLTSQGISGTLEGGYVSVSENIYLSNPELGPADLVGNGTVRFVSMSDMDLAIDGDLMFNNQPIEVTEIWVRKGVSANGGMGQTGVASLNQFYQTFSQIPEPTTAVLLAAGGVAALFFRRRRK